MRALLITVSTGKAAATFVEADHFTDISKHLGCEYFGWAGIPAKGHVAYWDESGSSKVNFISKVSWKDGVVLGNILITGIDDDGNGTPCKLPVEWAEKNVTVIGLRGNLKDA